MDAERFLSKMISTVASSPDLQATIENLAQLASTQLAQACAVFMFENEQTIRRVALVCREQGAANAPSPEVVFPLNLHASTGPGYVFKTGDHQVLENLTATRP